MKHPPSRQRAPGIQISAKFKIPSDTQPAQTVHRLLAFAPSNMDNLPEAGVQGVIGQDTSGFLVCAGKPDLSVDI